MRYPAIPIRLVALGLFLSCGVVRAAMIIANHDNPGDAVTEIATEAASAQPTATANYAVVPVNSPGFPLQLTDDGGVILATYNGGNVYAYRWKQGVVTELSVIRPAGTRIKLHAANRKGMVVVVFEMPNRGFFTYEGGSTTQVVVAWMPHSSTPVFLNVPTARATTWFNQNVMRSVEFKFLDDQNRIWGNTYHEVDIGEGNLVYPELARWDTPDAAPVLIGHGQFQEPSVNLLGVSSGSGEPFGLYSPAPAGSGTYYFAGSFSNRLTFAPSKMNSQGWVLGRRGFTALLSRNGVERPLPANYIALIDDRNNLYDINRFTVWTTNPQTLLSTPEDPLTPYVALPTQPIALPGGYSSNQLVVPGSIALELGDLSTATATVPALFVPAEIRPDANRDGQITVDRRPVDPDRELAEKRLPWYYWINDDNDSGETGGSDIPGAGGNGQDAQVNGLRDLIDFFPLHLNIRQLLEIFPPSAPGISYRLAQADGAANFLTTDLTPVHAGDYLGANDGAKTLGSAAVTQITNDGVALDPAFLNKIGPEDKGVILLEARRPTTQPLRLEVWHGAEQVAYLDLPLRFAGVETMFRHKNLVSAVNMKAETADRAFAPNWPDALNNKQAFVFVHGYNVNQKQARGWQAEFFKRLWWSGSRAQFWGVTWYGTDSQVPVADFTPNYQLNVVHAFGTAPIFREFIEALKQSGDPSFQINVAGHSLGNLVVSSAISDYSASINRYFMIDAAVAAEAYDGAQGSDHVLQPDDATAFLPHTEWNKERNGVYPPRLWASNWYKRFPVPTGNPVTDDARAKLTWRDRFAPKAGTDYYDFHSTGEEVLGYDEQHTENTPSLAGVIATELAAFLHITKPGQKGQPNGYQSWIYQEQLKGRTITGKILGSNYGGWGFNNYVLRKTPMQNGGGPRLAPIDMTPEDAAAAEPFFLDSDLQAEPFFRPGGFFTKVGTWKYDPVARKNSWSNARLRLLYNPATGSAFASAHRDTLLARMIPAMSPPAGRIPVPRLTSDAGEERNFDMSGTVIRPARDAEGNPRWPGTRGRDFRWWHSDLREIAYPYVRGLYTQIRIAGNLGEAAP